MNKFLSTLIFAMGACIAFAEYGVLVNEDYELDFPTASQLINANSEIAELGESAVWGEITGSISNQTDLTSTLSNYVSISDLGNYLGSYATSSDLASSIASLTKSNVGLGNVDNTSDLNKPISTATQTALNLKLAISDVAKLGRDFYIDIPLDLGTTIANQWTDFEIKVVDPDGYVLFYTRTFSLSYMIYGNHSSVSETSPVFKMLNCNAGVMSTPITVITSGLNTSSLGATYVQFLPYASVRFYPNLTSTTTKTIWNSNYSGGSKYLGSRVWGDYVREVFTNPDNTIVYLRFNGSTYETVNDKRVWRMASPTYYGDFKIIEE